jgi:NADP-dependent 3-hydroxy acid dehydrogenase YdfG
MTERIDTTLCGRRAERFEEIREEIEDARGQDVTNVEVISRLFESWDGI